MWVDFDIGNYADDFAGCDTTRNMFFAYNGDSNDEGADGYGFNPPAQGVVFLNHRMNSFYSYDNSTDVITGNPLFPEEFYNCMQGVRLDGSPVMDNKNKATPFTFYGEPGVQNQYNPANAGKTPADLRGIGSIGPYNMAPGQSVCMDLAFVSAFGKDPSQKGIPTLKQYADRIQSVYDNGNDIIHNILCSHNRLVGLTEVNTAGELQVFPNPGSGLFHISGLPSNGQNTIYIYSTDGRVVYSTVCSDAYADLQLGVLAPGIYHIGVVSPEGILQQRLIIE